MDTTPTEVLLTLGIVFLLGLVADLVGRKSPVPRVALLVCIGFAIGPGGLDLVPKFATEWFPVITDVALVMVGFLVGGTLHRSTLMRTGRAVVLSSIAVTLVTFAMVLFGALLCNVPFILSLLLAAVATATDPAAVTDTIREIRAKGDFTSIVRGIVALDDAWGLVIFTAALAVVQSSLGNAEVWVILSEGAFDLLGAIILGVVLGLPMAFLTGRIRAGEPTQAEAVGVVLLCGGIALWLEVSYLLSAMVMGMVVANVARHHRRPFHAIEGIEWPFLMIFFVLAGASLQPSAIPSAGLLLLTYIVLRVLGRLIGGLWCRRIAGLSSSHARWLGPALLPQAGVAVGMALVAREHVPVLGDVLLQVVLGGTILFEAIGPLLTRMSLVRVGDAKRVRKQ